MTTKPADLTQDAALLALIDLVIDAVDDSIAVAESGSITILSLAKFSNLIAELPAAFSNIGLVPAEIKALTFDDAAPLVLHVVGKLNITSTKAVTIIQDTLKIAADVYSLILAIKAPA